MAHGPITTNLFKSLKDVEQRAILSMAIDEIERETYWETRQEMLYRYKKELTRIDGDALKLTDYMLEKPRPETN